MGNCQAVDAATLIIQHPSGKVDKLYWPVNAGEVMKSNPGHYVALLLSTTLYPSQHPPEKPAAASSAAAGGGNSLRITRIKLLRPTDTLLLGHVYRLVTSQEVMKGLYAKKQAKHNKTNNPQTGDKIRDSKQSLELKRFELEKDFQVGKSEKNRGKTSSAGRSKAWQPSLNSISESGS